MLRGNWAREPQLLSLRVWSPCSATGEAAIVRGLRTAMKSGPCSLQLEKALAQKRRPNTAKQTNKQKPKNKKKQIRLSDSGAQANQNQRFWFGSFNLYFWTKLELTRHKTSQTIIYDWKWCVILHSVWWFFPFIPTCLGTIWRLSIASALTPLVLEDTFLLERFVWSKGWALQLVVVGSQGWSHSFNCHWMKTPPKAMHFYSRIWNHSFTRKSHVWRMYVYVNMCVYPISFILIFYLF